MLQALLNMSFSFGYESVFRAFSKGIHSIASCSVPTFASAWSVSKRKKWTVLSNVFARNPNWYLICPTFPRSLTRLTPVSSLTSLIAVVTSSSFSSISPFGRHQTPRRLLPSRRNNGLSFSHLYTTPPDDVTRIRGLGCIPASLALTPSSLILGWLLSTITPYPSPDSSDSLRETRR